MTLRLTSSSPRMVNELITFEFELIAFSTILWLPALPLLPPLTVVERAAAPEEGAPAAPATKPEAISIAFWASSADATEPVRMIESSTVRTWMSLPGIATLRRFDSSLTSRTTTSRPTETSTVSIFRPSLLRAKMVVCPLARAET